MREDEVVERRLLRPQYPGDDIRPTSEKELLGWYSYGWAAEVFTVCAMGKDYASACEFFLGLTTARIIPTHHIRANGPRTRCPVLGQDDPMQCNLESPRCFISKLGPELKRCQLRPVRCLHLWC